jgi:HlyD family secretion protein
VAGLEVDFARKFQSKDAEIFSRREIISSAIDEELATNRQEHAHDVRGIRDTQGKAEMSLITVDRKKADIKIGHAQTGLKALEVTAPHDGLFVLKREWGDIVRVGETVWPGQPVAEIPDLTKMKAKIYVLEADAGGLEPGRQASVIVDSQAGKRWPAKVSKVAAFAKPRNRWLPVQYFEVELELEKTDPTWMKPGQRVRADLSLEDRKDALVVPREAVQEKDGKHLVWKKDAKGFSPVEVTLGPAALGRVVIEKGRSEKDVVALRDPTAPEPLPGSKKAEPQNGGGGGGGGGGIVIIR